MGEKRFSSDSITLDDCVCANNTKAQKTTTFLFVFILRSPDEQIHHFRKEIDICKKNYNTIFFI